MNSGLSHELQAFICQHIHSVEQLEVLLLLKRSDAREWTAAATAGDEELGKKA